MRWRTETICKLYPDRPTPLRLAALPQEQTAGILRLALRALQAVAKPTALLVLYLLAQVILAVAVLVLDRLVLAVAAVALADILALVAQQMILATALMALAVLAAEALLIKYRGALAATAAV